MLRILHCLVKLDRGGTETLLMNLYRNLDRTQVQFDFLTSFPGAYEAEITALGGRVYHTPFFSEVGPLAYARNLRRFFEQHPQYTIVHAHMDKFSGMVVRQAKKAGVPVRIAHSHSIRNEGGFAVQLVKNYYGSFVNPCATHLFACSAQAAQWMFGRRAPEAMVLHNGVDTSLFCPAPAAAAQDLAVPTDAFVVGHVARYTPAKNHAFLLEVFRTVLRQEPRAQLVLVGDGPLLEETKAKARTMGLQDAVHFLGARADVAAVMQRFDAFCMPSLFEGLGIVLVEAQACGIPCVASDTIPQEANVTGEVTYLSLHASADTWAAALLAQKGKPKHNNTKKICEAGYDIRTSARQLQAFYLACAAQGNAAQK